MRTVPFLLIPSSAMGIVLGKVVLLTRVKDHNCTQIREKMVTHAEPVRRIVIDQHQ
jgi:hypothetical protein